MGFWVYVFLKFKEDCGFRCFDGEYLFLFEWCDVEVGIFLFLNGLVCVVLFSGWLLEFLRVILSCDCNLYILVFSDEVCED